MNIEESIIEFKKMIERDKDTLRYWKSDTFGHYDEPIKKLEKDVLISETLLTAYEKEKETSHYIQSELDIANAKLVEEKEKTKKAIDFINERKKTVNKDMAEGTRLQVGTFMWQVDELLEILKEE